MPALLRRFSFLVYYLAVYLIGFPCAFAKSKTIPPDSAAPKTTALRLAVVELNHGRVKPEVTEKVADTLQDELIQKGRFSVISKQQVRDYFQKNPNGLQGSEGVNPLNRYLDQAKEFYKTFAFKDAIALLENTIETHRQAKDMSTDAFLLTDAYLMLGNIHLGNNDPKKAVSAFQEAVRLDPNREITEREYPPKTIRSFTQAREDYLKKAGYGRLEVGSSPSKADVYINGNLKGQTPLKIERYTTGEHFILVKQVGYKPAARKIKLQAAEHQERFSMEKVMSREPTKTGLSVAELRDIPEQVRLASALGRNLQADKVVLVSVEEIGWNNKITARMIDIKYQASHKHQSVEVLDLPKDTRSAASVIAADLSGMADVDLAKNPKKFAESDVIVIGTKKKKSFFKSPLLWGVIGAVVAGGAAGAFLLTRGGGGSSNTSTVSLSGSAGRAP